MRRTPANQCISPKALCCKDISNSLEPAATSIVQSDDVRRPLRVAPTQPENSQFECGEKPHLLRGRYSDPLRSMVRVCALMLRIRGSHAFILVDPFRVMHIIWMRHDTEFRKSHRCYTQDHRRRSRVRDHCGQEKERAPEDQRETSPENGPLAQNLYNPGSDDVCGRRGAHASGR